MWLSREGSRCWMRTKAIPVRGGIALKNLLNASSPPAEAPMPTTSGAVLMAASATTGFAAAQVWDAFFLTGLRGDPAPVPVSPGPPLVLFVPVTEGLRERGMDVRFG